jgi:N-acetyl sugar amidotransferase
MTQLRYCKTCILPNTRPNLHLDDQGVCNACSCASVLNKAIIDWNARERQFQQLVDKTKAKSRTYDCVIPVSGGKDSTWQVVKALEYGLNPLCVTWKTPARNTLGSANLQNLISLGVNHIDFSINPKVERLFTLKAFERMGSPVIPMHMALYAIPLQVAVGFGIPLILWGENSAFEYGGDDDSLKGLRLTHAWLKRYGVTNGTTAHDWIDQDLTAADLTPYSWPSDSDQDRAGVSAVFLGHFFSWDPHHTYEVAKKHGFQAGDRPKTGYYAFADIDDEFLITIHHWMKWYKFGFTRLWDNLSLEIRNGRMTREQAVDLVRAAGEELPRNEIADFCSYVGISEKRFFEIAESFRNKDIWKQGKDAKWRLEGFLVDDWEWAG